MNESAYSEILDGEVLTRLSGQFLHARQPMVGNIVGHHKSPYRGSSVEFAEYRKYVPGDDPRLLDWRVLARTDRYYIREFEADTNLRCYVVLDCSKSMSFGEKGVRKFEYARKIAATLSYMLVHQGDAVGLEICDDGVVTDIPPRRNPLHLKYRRTSVYKSAAMQRGPCIRNLPSPAHPRTSPIRCFFQDGVAHYRPRIWGCQA